MRNLNQNHSDTCLGSSNLFGYYQNKKKNQTQENKECLWDVEKLELSGTVSRDHADPGKQCGASSKIKSGITI